MAVKAPVGVRRLSGTSWLSPLGRFVESASVAKRVSLRLFNRRLIMMESALIVIMMALTVMVMDGIGIGSGVMRVGVALSSVKLSVAT